MVSLHRKLLLWLLLPQLILWLAGGVATYRLAASYANRAIDASLAQTSRTLLRQVKPIDQGLLIDFPRAAQDVLEADPNDRLMYTVSTPPGRFILGNGNLPPPPPAASQQLDVPYFYDAKVAPQPGATGASKQMRIAALYVAFGDISSPKQTMLVQVARSSANREELARAILADTLLPLSALVLLMSMIVWAGIRAGLAPLARLRREVESRAPDDLTPLKLDLAPVELRSLAGALNDLLASVQHQVGAQKRFIGDAAHQLRTPLAGLKSQTRLALEAATDDDQRSRLALVHQSATRSAHLVAQLLTLARAEPGSAPVLERTQFDLRRFAQDIVVQLVPRGLRAGVDLGFEDDEGAEPVPVQANSLLLREALTNLIDNAIQYAGHGAEITVKVRRDGASALLVVEDDGPGIPEADRARVFERFFRATYQGDGCGLGLAIVKEIVERHSGSVTLEEVQPHGLRVLIRLPPEA
ncbi:sensor histidine kinase [Pseudoduganella namucuonensis]|uniref:histidine kinase n=1 Tax=Pseudoduganella namucuonensis TaxID=1035707 RepID=A0A1I7K312_9BURK|nr:sensor histidine kinase [Pseudoduganella namucuonensis]SFU91826.1 two-component system, OmpR family, sensor histidine kinase TctE [Pseudoduganella namucuonensis]